MLTNIFKAFSLVVYDRVVKTAKSRNISRKNLVPPLLTIAYLVAIVLMAKISNPQYMGYSLGVFDSILRAHFYAIFKVLTLDLNPIYVMGALFPLGILLSFWRFSARILYMEFDEEVLKISPHLRHGKWQKLMIFLNCLFLIGLVLAVILPINHHLQFIDMNMISQLASTSEVEVFFGDLFNDLFKFLKS